MKRSLSENAPAHAIMTAVDDATFGRHSSLAEVGDGPPPPADLPLAYLFDTDAASEVLRPRHLPTFLDWLRDVPLDDQYISAITVGEL